MILTDSEMKERLESPVNLLNRLRALSSPAPIVTLPPTSSELIPDIDDKINDTKRKSKAILNKALDELSSRMPEVQKPEKLAQIAYEMSRAIAQQEAKEIPQTPLAAQIVIYAPQVQSIENFDIVDVQE